MRSRTLAVYAAALALAACGTSGQKEGGADTTAVQAAPVTAPAVPPSAPTGADSAMAGHNMGSDTMTHDTMKKDSTGM
ncbi:MAG TPA: hypothetical protein VM890_15150 [Longimicrobium sp.]|jgi:hypothetical protein|nr:hypothetical protein [Longimicrobium sp.]